jgi:hypothetical protein
MKVYVLIVGILIHLNCHAQSPSAQAKKVKYKLNKEVFVPIDSLMPDTNAVYLEQMNPSTQNEKTVYTFLRFFADGRVFCSEALEHIPSEEDFNDLKNGQRGYYRFYKGSLKMELKSRTSTHFEYYFMKLNGNQIFLYRYKGRAELIPIRKKLDVWYQKRKVNLYSKADW